MSPGNRKVAVVGAGLGGSMCARMLADRGFRVTAFDKGRGPGGRASTRRAGGHSFDHGAQYFTVRDPSFRLLVERWMEAGVVDRWSGSLAVVQAGSFEPLPAVERYVGTPGMNAITRELLRDLEVGYEATVERATRAEEGWYLSAMDSPKLGPYDYAIFATPPAQAVAIVGQATNLLAGASRLSMIPCWASVFSFVSRIDFPFDGAFVKDSPLSWIARDSSKPGRRKDQEVWVLHASPEWSAANLEQPREFVRQSMLEAFVAAVGPFNQDPNPLLTHRWRYARPARPAGCGFLYDSATGLGFCGDWLSDGRVESAALSGMQLADRIIAGGAS